MSRGALLRPCGKAETKKRIEQVFCIRSKKNGPNTDPHVSLRGYVHPKCGYTQLNV